jgi:hypothetical protein
MAIDHLHSSSDERHRHVWHTKNLKKRKKLPHHGVLIFLNLTTMTVHDSLKASSNENGLKICEVKGEWEENRC